MMLSIKSVFTLAIHDSLNEKSYILPGLGGAGGKVFGTKYNFFNNI